MPKKVPRTSAGIMAAKSPATKRRIRKGPKIFRTELTVNFRARGVCTAGTASVTTELGDIAIIDRGITGAKQIQTTGVEFKPRRSRARLERHPFYKAPSGCC